MRSSQYSINMKPASAQTFFFQVQDTADSNEKTEGTGLKQEKSTSRGAGVGEGRENSKMGNERS